MLVDFEKLHREYLVGTSENNVWVFKPTNDRNPRKGMYPSSHQIFSNAGLQVALCLYNSVNEAGQCVGVSHCLYLNFTRRVDGDYLLNNDRARITFSLDLGAASDLYSFVTGEAGDFSYRAVRAGRAPKSIRGTVQANGAVRSMSFTADATRDGQSTRIDIEIDRTSQIAIAAHCIAYGRLLYPALSDLAVQSLLSPARNFRACAEKTIGLTPSVSEPQQDSNVGSPSKGEHLGRVKTSPDIARLGSAVWAIGNQKWPRMTLKALKAIQAINDAGRLQELVDQGNAGDFRAWDSFLT